SVDITLVSRDNFFLFTPMLPEVSSGMIETRHIVTPIRTFCNRAKFYEANIESVDLENKQIRITHAVGKETDPIARLALAGTKMDVPCLISCLFHEM
ncbi:MAG: hypothetical protein WBF33_00985, partial [Candidatus Nitrosopolaris sp.]